MTGRVIKYGDNVSTDAIIAGKYTKTLDIQSLAEHAMEDLDPEFRQKVRTRTVIAAGTYFGCGSSREQAPTALMAAGVQCVLAKEFARIFYRNAINMGMCVAECDTSLIDEGDEIRFAPGAAWVENLTKGIQIPVTPMPQSMVDILTDGGVVNYLKDHDGKMGD